VFLLKLCWDGGKDEMTACVSKNVLEASTGICSGDSTAARYLLSSS
jgi:hypothetical protein